ncbi:MAG: glycoside hydrolase family 78 protein, partial [Oscillospiraceae bacterium]|nr:glycoside hydrolase family 78 protein [Oscillospiraceae bacterium]
EWIVSDESWQGSKSPVLFSEIYDGEIYDSRLEQSGWTLPGFDGSGWFPTEMVERDLSTLFPQSHPPVRETEQIAPTPTALLTTPQGDKIIDFGQNLSGWCEFTVDHPKAGDVVELRFFEILDADGNVYIENLRGAKQTLRYTCKGADLETYRPWFTFQGFQYAQIVSWPGEASPDNFTAHVAHSALERTGSFRCSNSLLNRLWHNILWGMKGNFVDIPTDCPQRDERLGWTGDINVFSRTASFLMDTDAFCRKWLADTVADQNEAGAVPHVIPDVLSGHMESDWLLESGFQGGASCWGDVTVCLPWVLYLTYGDKAILEQQMDSMLAWVRYQEERSDGCLFKPPFQFGDWLALDSAEGSYKGATPDDYSGAAWYCRCVHLMSRILFIVGRNAEADAMAQKANAIKADFQHRFFSEDGTLTVRTQTAHVLALAFGLVPDHLRAKTAAGLKNLLVQANGHLTTGFMGTPFLAAALSENGLLDDAYNLVLKEDFPSWLYQVKQGATTVWEHWDGKRPDGTMWSADMNSFNHYAYGSIGEWLVRTVAGLELDEDHPGYEHFYIRPQSGGGLTWAEANYDSVRGNIAIRWERSGDIVTLEMTIPANTTATIQLTQAGAILDSGGLVFTGTESQAGSGRYTVRYRLG